MKKSLHVLACCMVCTALFHNHLIAQAQEKTANPNVNNVDDLAPYPFDDQAPEKTFGEKIKESIIGEQEPPDSLTRAARPEEYIRFYEFKDVTFDSDEMEFETEDIEIGPMDEYKMIDEGTVFKEEYYKDVTFENENKARGKEDIIYDDAPYLPHQKKSSDKSTNADEYYSPNAQKEQTIKIKSTPQPTAKPIEIKSKDFYRKDYIYFYYNRKKKADGNVASSSDYSTAMERCRYLLKEDKKAVRVIYETQLQEADNDFSDRINDAVDLGEKEKLESAMERTKIIIKRVFEEEGQNLQNAFDKAAEGLDKKFNGNKQPNRGQNNRKIKQGD